MTDLGDVLASLAPAIISVIIVVGVAVVSGRRQRKREEKP